MYAIQEGLYKIGQQNLFGSGMLKSKLITSTALSETAKRFATALGVEYEENYPLNTYPLIKCNVNKATNEKIYHLPFDQQYDRVQIKNDGEFFAWSVAEAENSGFRRAKKWITQVS